MGKKKIDIKKINNKNYLKATFSKRRKGLFRKATDLCCLSGAQIAIITFSPGNKPFVFGHPSAEAVIERFLGEQTSCATDDMTDDHDDDGFGSVVGSIGSLDRDDDPDDQDQDQAMQDERVVEGLVNEEEDKFWWDEEIDEEELDLIEVKKYKSLLERLRENAACKLEEMERREVYTKDYLGLNLGLEVGCSTFTERDLCE